MSRHILKKIRMLFIREKDIFSLIIICTFISSILLCFSFGLFCNYIEKKNAQVYDLRMLEITFDNNIDAGRYLTKKQIETCLLQFSENVTNDVQMFFVRTQLENETYLECRFEIKDGNYLPCVSTRDNLTMNGNLKNYFTEDEEKYGEKVAIIPGKEWAWNDLTYLEGMLTGENQIIIQGKEYKIIGYHGWGNCILLPFAALDEDTVMDSIGLSLSFRKVITLKQYNEVKKVVEQTLGDIAVVPPIPAVNEFLRSLYNTVLLITILIAGLIAINFSILYQYVLLHRKKEIGIFLACGLSKFRATVYIMLEGHLLLLPSFLLGIIVFNYLILPFISWMIPYSLSNYNLFSYFCLTVIFSVISVLITGGSIAAFIYKCEIVKVLQEDSE